jgi:hypothetical protein
VVLDGGKFEPREVVLGAQGERDVLQVLSGLEAGERVVTSGQFMLDSESQLREVIQKMLPAETMTSSVTPIAAVDEVPTAKNPASANIVYLCPMEEHMAIRYDHLGKCPLCNMTLVPVSESNYNRIVEEKWTKEHPAEAKM